MSRAIGSASRIIMGEETVWAQPPAPFNGLVLSSLQYGESLRGSREELLSDTITSRRSHLEAIQGNESAGGSFPFNLSIEGIPKLLKHALGPVQTSGTGPYDHVIKRGALPIGMHVEKQFLNMQPAQYIVYPGARVSVLNLSIANTGLITGTLDVMAKNQGAMSGTPLDASPTEPNHYPIHHKSATTVEAGGVSANIVGFELSITNNLDESDYIIGSAQKQSLDEGKGDVTGTVTFRFENSTHYEKWFNDAQDSIKVNLTWPSSLGTMEFFVPKNVYNGEVGPAIETSQGIILAMPFRGIEDSVQQSDIVITIQNNEATI